MNSQVASKSRNSYILPMIIISALFFIFGFVTWLNSILIPYLQIACELNRTEAFFVTTAFYIAYTIMALPSAWVLKKTGLKNGMMIGLWVMAVGTILFIPAAYTRTYAIFLLGLFIMGTGLAILQTASNPYVTIMGPRESAAKRISVLGICNKAAGALAPLILAYYILSDGDAFMKGLESMNEAAKVVALDDLAKRVINPYIVMTVILFIMGIGVRISGLPELEVESEEDAEAKRLSSKKSIWEFPHLILGVITLFFYVGVEVMAGDTIIVYGRSLDVPLNSSKYFASMVMMGMVIGYIVGIIFIPKYLNQRKALVGSAGLGIILAVCAIFVPDKYILTFNFIDITSFKIIELTMPYTVLFVALFGISNALVWPAVWPLAIHNLGGFLKTGSAMLIMAISGGAILPQIWGVLSDSIGSQSAFILALLSYFVILFYALRGYKLTSWK
ncbi:MAG: sugar MFS transporter [Prolixibacteraceae bacterium]|nr:sugar MFS transporter [Prolixibacteraceae bacterium]MBN2775883.1 sugar MFS transporter [Prolixibacteraceae bacterium]